MFFVFGGGKVFGMKKIIIILAILILGLVVLMFVDKNYKDIGFIDVYIMQGESMEPTFLSGDKLYIDKDKEVEVGDVVVFTYKSPNTQNSSEFIKRVKSITDDGKYFVVGDNLERSLDSRTFGPIEKNSIIGVVNKI